MKFLRSTVAMMAMAFSVAMFACSDDEEGTDPGTDPVNPGGDSTEVVVPVTALSIDPTSLDLLPGESDTLTVTITPENATDTTLTWESSAPDFVTVDICGVVKVVAYTAEPVTITVTANGGENVTATCTVTQTLPEGLQVGDYVYSDGETSSRYLPIDEQTSSHQLIGIVYYVFEDGEVPQDNGLVNDVKVNAWRGYAIHPTATAVSGWSSNCATYAVFDAMPPTPETNIVIDWAQKNVTDYDVTGLTDVSKMNGYSNCQIYTSFNENAKYQAYVEIYPDNKDEEPYWDYAPVTVDILTAPELQIVLGGRTPALGGWGSNYYVPSVAEWG